MDWQELTSSRLADAAAGGLIVLAAGSLAARFCRQPVRRARLIVLSLLGALAVPALGALPVAPRWSAGLPAAPGAILAGDDPAAPAEAGSRPHWPRATGSRVALGAIELPGEMPAGYARIGPALAPSGPAASAPAARWHRSGKWVWNNGVPLRWEKRDLQALQESRRYGLVLAVVATDGEISGMALAVERALGSLASKARKIVHGVEAPPGKGCDGDRSG
jgi:hypothetical protein